MRRLTLALAALLAAAGLSGCERLCAPDAVGKFVGGDGEPPPLPAVDTVAIGREVVFESLSTDLDGDDLHLEWDLDGDGPFERDGDGPFERDRGAAPGPTTSYDTAGERFVRLRVTDTDGATATHGRTLVVRPPSPRALAHTAVAPRRAWRLPFAARERLG